MSSRIKQFFKSAEAAVWTAANPLLKEGEPGFESDTNKMKVGDGLNRWNDLEYQSSDKADVASLPVISDVAYNESTWNANTDGATKNAIRDKIESLDAAKANLSGATFTGLVRHNSELSVTTIDVEWDGVGNLIKMDGTSEECSVNMSDGTTHPGAIVFIYCYNIDNPCTANFSSLFGGSYSFTAVGETITIISTGAGWQVISTYTP